MKKLKDPEPPLDLFFSRACELGEKLGPVLFQLPPRWGLNLERLDTFLDALPRDARFTLEFRDPSWIVPDVIERLRARNVAFCIYDLAGYQSPLEVTADFVYLRLHGPEGGYSGRYSGPRLHAWKRRIEGWLGEGKDVYIYFDNDLGGAAVLDALELQAAFAAKGARAAAA